jgi:uncharacterized phage protein gp47/JayE
MTNVPSIVFSPTGPVAPSEAAVLAGVQQDYDDAFGGGLDPSLSTPQGQLATSTSAIVGNVNDTFVNMANQFNPDFATDRWQDALAAIYFLQRNPSQPTVVQAVCTGGQGLPIPAGAIAQATDGNIYTCTNGGVIDNTGSITLTFACNAVGPVPCPANTLTKIARAIPGWDSINNPSDGVLGNETETRAEFATRRKESVAANARGTIQAVQGSVLSVAGVLDAFSIQNDTASSATISGVTVAKNSIYVSAVGGADADVAKAIWTKKSPGCGYGGNTTVSVVDDSSGYSPPLPSYPVTFERPTSLPIFFAVVLANSLQVPSDVVAQVQAAIIAAFAGSDGGARARIGSTIYSSRYYPPIAALGAWANIISVLVSSANTPAAAFTGVIVGSTLTVSALTSGAVAIGQTIVGVTDSFGSATTILAGSGTTWTVSTNFNVPSRLMLGIVANQTLASVHADQAPTVNANNILVTLT